MSFLNDLTLQQIVTRGLAYFIVAAVHGGLLGLILPRDPGAPVLPRVSVWGLFMAILFRAGWTRPPSVPRAPLAAGGRWRLVLAVLGASAGTLALIPLADLARPLIPGGAEASAGRLALILLGQVQEVALGLALLALVPWPALTGRLLLVAAVPSLATRFGKWEGPATLVLVAAMVAAFEPQWFQRAMPLLSLVR